MHSLQATVKWIIAIEAMGEVYNDYSVHPYMRVVTYAPNGTTKSTDDVSYRLRSLET